MYTFLNVATATLALAWLAVAVYGMLGMRRIPRLRDFAPLPNEDCPPVSLLVAARDEAEKIEAAAKSWLALDYPNLQIIAVDDRSTDATGEILDRLAERDKRLKVIHLTDLPPGWLGKSHALTRAFEHATGEWLLLTDADVHMTPDTLRRSMSLVRTLNLDHTTGLARFDLDGMWVRAVLGAAMMGVFVLAQPWRCSHPKSKLYIGMGAFQLLSRTAYETIGTHKALALEVVEDMALARAIKQHGFRTGAFLPDDSVRLRYVNNLREYIRISPKNAFAIVDFNIWLAATAVLLALVSGVLPFALLPFVSGWPLVFTLATLATLLTFNGFGLPRLGVPPYYALLHPVGAIVLSYILVRGVYLNYRDGGIYWRGTFHSLKDVRRKSG